MPEEYAKKNALAAQREYMKRWRSQNREKVQNYNRTYWERRAERECRAAQEAENDTNN
jgi:hypothetical protein